MKEESNTSLLVFYSLAFLFIVFILVGTPKTTSLTTSLVTLPIVGDTAEISLTTTIGIAVTVLVIAGAIFLITRKRKDKKQAEVPKTENLPQLTPQLNTIEPAKEPKVELSKLGKLDTLTEEDLDKLFTAARQPEMPPAPIKKEPEEEIVLQTQVEKQVERQVNYKELKSLIINLLNKNYTHDSILKYLKNKGYSLFQIRRAVDIINEENLANYVKQCYALGIEREMIIKNLLNHGWSDNEIRKQL